MDFSNAMFGGSGFFLQGVSVEGYSPYAYFIFQMAFVSKRFRSLAVV